MFMAPEQAQGQTLDHVGEGDEQQEAGQDVGPDADYLPFGLLAPPLAGQGQSQNPEWEE
jgi:hypothetical protein